MLGRFLFVVVVWFIGVATHAAAQAGAERAQLIPAICAALQSEYTYPDVAQKMADALRAQLVHAEDRATDAMVKVHELEQDLVTLRAELDSVTAAWHAAESMRRHA